MLRLRLSIKSFILRLGLKNPIKEKRLYMLKNPVLEKYENTNYQFMKLKEMYWLNQFSCKGNCQVIFFLILFAAM